MDQMNLPCEIILSYFCINGRRLAQGCPESAKISHLMALSQWIPDTDIPEMSKVFGIGGLRSVVVYECSAATIASLNMISDSRRSRIAF